MAYQLDTAIVTLGQIIEGALNEMENVGTEKEPDWQPKYDINELLNEDFRLPSKKEPEPIDALKGLVGKGVKVFHAHESEE